VKNHNTPQSETLFNSPHDAVAYMRARHPDEYSDSTLTTSLELTQSLLEYHLETITSRSQEIEFAYFARRLAEKEICPNLRSQTGPTGGGDSKADSETILVSSEISKLWIGSDPKAATERWAFAFSAKKAWKAKVRQDVRAIAATCRDYKRIYFITNQFTPDKSRAQSEDTLTKETGISVTILDRSWIITSVIDNGRTDLAIEALKIDALKSLMDRKVGPGDAQRQKELEELERNISDPNYYQGASYQLLEDCLRIALLARGLGRSRTEVDGYFIRAERLANEIDSDKHRLRIAYNYAWTAMFWFNDYHQLNADYDTVETLALKLNNAENFELVLNLWMVLLGQVHRKVLTVDAAKIEKRKKTLIDILESIASDDTRPNNSLQAKTSRTLIELQDAIQSGNTDSIDRVWATFRKIINEAESLGDYPVERLINLLNEMGMLGINSEEFDKLLESVIVTLEKRRSDVAGAGLLRDHGNRKLEAGKHYEAISLLGRALKRFIKRECRGDLVFCLMSLSFAYRDAGLLWVARSCALTAIDRCLAYFNEEGKIMRLTLPCLQQLTRMELLLGRIPHVLLCVELENALIPQLLLKQDNQEKFKNERYITESMLGIAILTASLDQLELMDKLPEALEELDLIIPKGFLLYALGYRDELRHEGFPDEWSDADIDNFIKQAYEQPGRLQLPSCPQIDNGKAVSYNTNILGCEIVVIAPASAFSISVAESVLGTLEAFFATSLNERIMPFRSSAKIVVEPSMACALGLKVEVENDIENSLIRVLHPITPPEQSFEARKATREGLVNLIASFMHHITIVDDIDSYLKKIGVEECGFERSLIYSEVSLLQENIFGPSSKILLRDWRSMKSEKLFPLRRDKKWSDDIFFNTIPTHIQDDQPHSLNKMQEFFQEESTKGKHSDRKIVSLIDVRLWNEAKWRGTLYIQFSDAASLPIMGLAFENWDAAKKIFKAWQKLLGDFDKDNQLRVTIITGVQRSNPASYKVLISTNINLQENNQNMMVMIGRVNMMTPTTSVNLDRFLQQLKTSPRFLLAPAHFTGGTLPGDFGQELCILKKVLVVRPAWEIGINDLDATGISVNDDPILPVGVEHPPVTQLLERMWRITQ
jgi:hypothetical protein